MGGAIVARFLAENRVKVGNAIIDGGITPYQLPYGEPSIPAIIIKCRKRSGQTVKMLYFWKWRGEIMSRSSLRYSILTLILKLIGFKKYLNASEQEMKNDSGIYALS